MALAGGRYLEDPAVAVLRSQLVEIISGTVFLFIGLVACAIAAIRRSGVRLFLWLGIWSFAYGTGLFTHSPTFVAVLPTWLQACVPYANTANRYLVVVIAFSAFLELTVGKLQLVMRIILAAAIAVAAGGIGWSVLGGSEGRFTAYNQFVTVCGLLVLLTVLSVRTWSQRYLVFVNRRVLGAGALVFVSVALWVNVSRAVSHYRAPALANHLGFGVFLLALGYVGAQRMVASERRLMSIEGELEVARQLQRSILPSAIPRTQNIRVAVSYLPMTAVAGDYYDFVRVDNNRIGVLVADVTGHGVPAALIASMIKVAMQSVVPSADDPRAVLSGLNRILLNQISHQLVSAAYLWLDMDSRRAAYSAAGHPPLLRSRQGKLDRIVSNGLLLGVMPNPDYPVCALDVSLGDRFLLYTDGLIEPQNARGDSFGDSRLEELVHENESRPPAEFADQLLSELRRWQPVSLAQQDDITLIVLDVA